MASRRPPSRSSAPYHPAPRVSGTRIWALRGAAAGLVALGAGVGAWYYMDNHNYDPTAPLPLILAEEGPSRVTPPGGSPSEQIAPAQLLVYDRLTPTRKSQGSTVIGQMAPDPEQPVELNAYLREYIGFTGEEIAEEDPSFIESLPEVLLKDKNPPLQAHIPVPVGNSAPRPPQIYRVQVADVPTPAQAAAAAQRLPHVGAHKVYIKRVDCGAERGIYYRVQIGDFSNYGPAQRLMETLQAAGLPATVVGF